jgi:hypothetical protein
MGFWWSCSRGLLLLLLRSRRGKGSHIMKCFGWLWWRMIDFDWLVDEN